MTQKTSDVQWQSANWRHKPYLVNIQMDGHRQTYIRCWLHLMKTKWYVHCTYPLIFFIFVQQLSIGFRLTI